MKTVRVSLGDRSYPICIGKGLLASAGTLFKKHGLPQQAPLIVTQKQVALYCLAPLRESLLKAGFEPEVFVTPRSRNSEADKSEAVFLKLVRRIAALGGRNRQPFLIALGGGVIGDLTGFAASVYRRGIPYVQVPTTLTAQVDSAIGGKTGIDLSAGKNLLGTFYQPRLVLADLAALESLPERHWTGGFAEVIKYGVIRDPRLFALLEARGLALRDETGLEDVIFRSVRIKAGIVEQDEFDRRDVRIALNFGHTTGHALEAAAGFGRAYTHGEGVAIGMLIACDIARQMGVLEDLSLTARLERILVRFRLPVGWRGLKTDALLEAMGYDKKSESGKNRFVLPVALGRTTVVRDVPVIVIKEALQKRRL